MPSRASDDGIVDVDESQRAPSETYKLSEKSVLFVSRDDANVRRVPFERELVLCISERLNAIDSGTHYNINRVILSGLPINETRRLFFEVRHQAAYWTLKTSAFFFMY